MGGSLLSCVPELVRVIEGHPQAPLLVVPGGGLFADRVRSIPTTEREAHWMAVAAMEQFGWYIASHGLPTTDVLEIPPTPRVLLPYCKLRELDPLPHSWEVTSDTIAAWVAHTMGAELIILKSVDGLFREDVFMEHAKEPFPCIEVDPAFLPFIFSHHIRCTVMNGSIPGRLEAFLQGAHVRATRVETTF
ncbi:MAG: uridylate kinase [Methanomicrobiales archaeon]|nr:uridylate kinase [Methanomicrobiales archaeon]